MDRRGFIAAASLAGLLPLVGGRGALAAGPARRLLPVPLRAGDTVALVSPSSATDARLDLQLSQEVMEALGFRVTTGAHYASRRGHLAGTDAGRAADINAAFGDPDVRAVIAVRGGSGAARLLPLLDYDLIRANPKLCGYNLTGILDHGMTGEGLWSYWREWKPATFDAVADGWSPLRWCLFADPLHGYSGREVTVEAVLATEDVLRPGQYPARFRVFGPAGIVWERVATVTIPDPPPLAVPVIRETFRLAGPPGRYTFAANLERGGAATGGSLAFHVSDTTAWPRLPAESSVILWGIESSAERWLTAQGLECRQLEAGPALTQELILIGKPEDAGDSERWKLLKQRMTAGATLLFLSAQLFKDNQVAMDWLPLKNRGRCYTFNDWLYHKECVAKRHPVFAGLQGPGILDMDYYGRVIPHEVFEGIDTPDETIVAAFATGHHSYPRGYGSSIVIGTWRSGGGRFILSTPYVLENLDLHPAADRLLLNLVRYGMRIV